MKTIKLINHNERRNIMKIDNTKPLMIEVDENNIVKPNKTNMRVTTLKKLKAIVTQSINNNYNRILKFDEYFKTIKKKMIKFPGKFGYWNGKQTKVLIQPIMIHQHAQMKQVEDHMRCLVRTGNTIAPDVIQDIPMKIFNTLDLALPIYEASKQY